MFNPPFFRYSTTKGTSDIITHLCYCSAKQGLPTVECLVTGYRRYEKSDLEYPLVQ